MSDPTAPSKNGDTLKELQHKLAIVQARVIKNRNTLAAAKLAIEPIQLAADEAINEWMNLSCRIDIWRKEMEK